MGINFVSTLGLACFSVPGSLRWSNTPSNNCRLQLARKTDCNACFEKRSCSLQLQQFCCTYWTGQTVLIYLPCICFDILLNDDAAFVSVNRMHVLGHINIDIERGMRFERLLYIAETPSHDQSIGTSLWCKNLTCKDNRISHVQTCSWRRQNLAMRPNL